MDELGAFVGGERVRLPGAVSGPLSGLRFAAKDNFDVAGFVTGAGNPDWARTHPRATATAPAILRLLDSGASLEGKTQMDELAWGSIGGNTHYGTPINPVTPDRVPGGSSSGSASAVAGGLVDFALGTDSACSVRLPASYCGLFGYRPTTGRVPLEGVVPLSEAIDTVGWFAREAALLERVGDVLLDAGEAHPAPAEVLIATDAFAVTDTAVAAALRPSVERIASRFETVREVRAIEPGQERGIEWLWFRAWSVEGREAWRNHGDWIESVRPNSRVLSRENFAAAADSMPAEDNTAYAWFAELREEIRRLVAPGSVLCLPTAAELAPLLTEERPALRMTMCLLSIAGIGGLPQVTLPLANVDGVPAGLSLVGWPGSDEQLLALAREVCG